MQITTFGYFRLTGQPLHTKAGCDRLGALGYHPNLQIQQPGNEQSEVHVH